MLLIVFCNVFFFLFSKKVIVHVTNSAMPWCNSDRLTAVKRLRPENENIFFPGVAEGDLNIFGLIDNLISSVSNV